MKPKIMVHEGYVEIAYNDIKYSIPFNDKLEIPWDAALPLTQTLVERGELKKEDAVAFSKSVDEAIRAAISEAYLKEVRFGTIKGEELEIPIKAHVFISGETGAKAINYKYKVSCKECGISVEVNFRNNHKGLYDLINSGTKWFGVVAKQYLTTHPECKAHANSIAIEPQSPPLIYYGAYIRDSIDLTTSNTSTNKNYFGYILDSIPNNKDVIMYGTLLMNKNNHDLEFIADKVIPAQSTIDTFALTSEDAEKLKNYFGKLKEYKDFKDLAKKNNPRIAGRVLAKLGSLLAYSSVLWLNINNDRRAGVVRVMFYGDPRTGKGKIGGYLAEKIGLGYHAVGETSSRTGISYSIDTDKKMITWGVLVEADRALLHIEGLHLFPPQDLASLRESFVKLYIEVRRLYSAKANARTRIIADSNAKKELSYYPFKCMAIKELQCFLDQVEITRWDAFIPFTSGDVDHDEITKAITSGQDDPEFLESFKTLVMWAWSRGINDVVYDKETIPTCSIIYKDFIKRYAYSELPIVNEDTFFALLRLATAFTVLNFSTDETCSKVVVKKEHVELASMFLEDCYDEMELSEYLAFKGKGNITDVDIAEFQSIIEDSDVATNIINILVDSTVSSSDLATMINASPSYVREICAKLKANGFITKTSKGYSLTPKGIQIWKRLKEKEERGNNQKLEEDYVQP